MKIYVLYKIELREERASVFLSDQVARVRVRVATSPSWCPLVLLEAEDDYILKQSPFIFSLAAVFTPHLHDFIRLEVKINIHNIYI